METFIFFTFVLVLIGLVVSISVLCLLAIILYRTFEQDMNIFPSLSVPKRLRGEEQDRYTPEEATDDTQNIEDFEPDFQRPLTVKVEGDAPDQDDPNIHPLTTSDIMTDPDEPKEEIDGQG